MRNFIFKNYNLNYIDCSDLIINIYICILKEITDVSNLKDKDLKKLVFHYLVKRFLEHNKKSLKRPVFYFDKNVLLEFTDKRYIKCFLYIIKQLKGLLPIPILIINDQKIFTENTGHMKGLNEKISNHYIYTKKNTVKLRKYLQNEDFYELINVFKDINSIRYIST